jgi:hypothetical protein
MKQSIRYSLVRILQNPSEGGARDIHLCCRLFLLITVKISQANGLELIQRQYDALEVRQRYSPGVEGAYTRGHADESPLVWTGHR